MEQGNELCTNAGPDIPRPSQGCRHSCVGAGSPQATMCGDRPAGQLGEGTSETPGLPLHIPGQAQTARQSWVLAKELPGKPTHSLDVMEQPRGKDRYWHKDTDEPQANLLH